MSYGVILALLLLALPTAVPVAAQEEDMPEQPSPETDRVTVQLKFEQGDVRHFTSSNHVTSATGARQPAEYTIGTSFTLLTEAVYPDNSADIRASIDDINVSGLGEDSPRNALVNAEYTYRLHPDGSVTDFDMPSQPAARRVDTFPSMGVAFPENGVGVGETFDSETAIPFLATLGDDARTVVHSTLEAVTDVNDRPAARVVQTISLPDYETVLGPFGSVGSAHLSMEGHATQTIDLETGWPISSEGQVTYRISVTGQGGDTNTIRGTTDTTLIQTDE